MVKETSNNKLPSIDENVELEEQVGILGYHILCKLMYLIIF